MSRFADIANAKVSGGGVYFLEGVYRIEIVECRAGTSTQDGYDFFVVEVKALESNNAERPVGSLFSWFVKLEKNTPALGNVKRFVSLACEIPEDDVDEAGCELIVSDQNPLAGVIMRASASNIITKKKKLTFTKVTFSTDDGRQRIV